MLTLAASVLQSLRRDIVAGSEDGGQANFKFCREKKNSTNFDIPICKVRMNVAFIFIATLVAAAATAAAGTRQHQSVRGLVAPGGAAHFPSSLRDEIKAKARIYSVPTTVPVEAPGSGKSPDDDVAVVATLNLLVDAANNIAPALDSLVDATNRIALALGSLVDVANQTGQKDQESEGPTSTKGTSKAFIVICIFVGVWVLWSCIVNPFVVQPRYRRRQSQVYQNLQERLDAKERLRAEKYADQCARRVEDGQWQANGRFALVEVIATYDDETDGDWQEGDEPEDIEDIVHSICDLLDAQQAMEEMHLG